MRLFAVGGVNVKCSVFVVCFVVLAAILNMWISLFLAFVSLSLHEASHALMARALGVEVISIEIQPFGFVAQLDISKIPSMDEFIISASGPVFSLVTGCVAAYVSAQLNDNIFILEEFIRFNIMIGALNLLPALPLDGGRMLRSLLERFVLKRNALLIAAFPGVLLGALLFLLGLYIVFVLRILNITPLIMGLFLFLAAIKELRTSNSAKLGAYIKRSYALRRGDALPAQGVAIHKSVTASNAIRTLSYNRYNTITIVDEDMRKLGEIDESKLIHAIAVKGDAVTLGELL